MTRPLPYLFQLAVAALLAAGCGGGGGEPEAPAEAPFESGPLSEEAPGEGTYVLDLAEERWIRVLPVHTSELWFVTASPDGETVVYEDDGGLVALDVEDGSRRRVLEAPISRRTALGAAFSPAGDVLAVWGAMEGPALTLHPWPEGEAISVDLSGAVHSAAWSADTLVVGAGDARTYLVSRETSDVQEIDIPPGAAPFTGVPGALRFAFSRPSDPSDPGAGVTVFTVASGEQPQPLVELPGWQTGAISWSSNGALLAVTVSRTPADDPVSVDSQVMVIDAATGETRFTVTSAGYTVVSWSPVEPLLMLDSSCMSQLLLVDGDGGLRPLVEQPGGIPTGHVWSPDGRRVATTWVDGGVTLIDVETGERRPVVRGPGLILNLQWPAPDRLAFTTTPGAGFCETIPDRESRVILP